jgi:hypothetical protein
MFMAKMYKVMVRCPRSHDSIDTGLRTSGRESLSSEIYAAGSFFCPACRTFHSLRDAGYLDVAAEALGQDVWRPNR